MIDIPIYAFVGSQEAQNYLDASSRPATEADLEPIPDALISRLHEMSSPKASEKEQRISSFLLALYEKGIVIVPSRVHFCLLNP